MIASLFGAVMVMYGSWSGPDVIYAAPPAPPEEIVIGIAKPETEEEKIKRLIRETFPEDPETALAIARAESRLKTDAVNPERHRGCHGSIGLMQIACVHHKENPEALKNIELNLQIARRVYDASVEESGDGWLPWGAYTNGSYLQHI